jgi:transcriptional regulator with XRE-family HTH domain
MDEQTIGKNIRSLRESKGLSLTEAAARAGLSKSALSKIETAQISSPIATLLSIASALDVHLSQFFLEPEHKPSYVVTRKGKAPVISRGGSQYGYAYQALALNMPDKLAEPFLLTVRPGDKRGVFKHKGQEFIYMLSGRMRMRLGEEEVILEPGDALYFDPTQEHTCEALDRKAAQFLCCFIQQP